MLRRGLHLSFGNRDASSFASVIRWIADAPMIVPQTRIRSSRAIRAGTFWVIRRHWRRDGLDPCRHPPASKMAVHFLKAKRLDRNRIRKARYSDALRFAIPSSGSRAKCFNLSAIGRPTDPAGSFPFLQRSRADENGRYCARCPACVPHRRARCLVQAEPQDPLQQA